MARTTKGYGIKDDARRSHIDIGDGEWAEIYYAGMTSLDAVRKGRRIGKFTSDYGQDSTAWRVSTNANLYFDLNSTARSRVIVREIVYGLHTLSDWLHVQIGYTATAGAVGAFTPLTPRYEFHTGTAFARTVSEDQTMNPPIAVTYTGDDARSIAIKYSVKDAAAEAVIAWSGWYETE